VNAAEELGVGGGTASGDGGEGATLAEETSEFEGRSGNGRDLRFVQSDSRAPRRTWMSGQGQYSLLKLNQFRWGGGNGPDIDVRFALPAG
jgi:hypothetical protein